VPGDSDTGLVTSPAVKLSPKAMNLVREMRGVLVVGPVGPVSLPHAATSAHAAATRMIERGIEN
jgi:hypothetical protein